MWKDGKNQVVKIVDEFTSKTSLFLMKHYPHPTDIIKLGAGGLRALSIEHNLKLRDTAIERLLRYADESISKPKEVLAGELLLLRLKLDKYDMIRRQIAELEEVIEELLLEIDGGFLLSIPGIGVTLAAELTAEMGDLEAFTNAGQLIKMAGTNPVVKQSGGKKSHLLRDLEAGAGVIPQHRLSSR